MASCSADSSRLVERQVQAGLDELMKGRTSLIIAHRLSTIAGVDRIITLRDGAIDEIGTPAELAVSGGIYSQLLALQDSGNTKLLRRFDITAERGEPTGGARLRPLSAGPAGGAAGAGPMAIDAMVSSVDRRED